MGMNLSAVDANLFLVLHAVLEERSATGAARRLHVTQSAVSNALARLRQVLGDPLVVRSGRGLTPTPRATELQPLLQEVAARLEQAIDRRDFVPDASTRVFTIALADNNQACDVPPIAATFAARLPRATLRVVSADYLVATDGLSRGDIDVAFVPEQAIEAGQRSAPLFEETAALVLRRDHPLAGRRLTRDQFNELPQIDVQVALGRPGVGHRVSERQFSTHGARRRIVLTVPYFMTAALAASQTDAAAVLPERLARLCCDMVPLTIVPVSFPLPRISIVMVWHERTDADPGARFFRQLVQDAVRRSGTHRAPLKSHVDRSQARGRERRRRRLPA